MGGKSQRSGISAPRIHTFLRLFFRDTAAAGVSRGSRGLTSRGMLGGFVGDGGGWKIICAC
eukprot:1181472-Prorocentrum_minimum.AAC.3